MTKDKINFQSKQEELEQIMSELQSGGLSIDDSIAKYSRANVIIGQLESYLEESQNQVNQVLESQNKK